jgi:DNA-binding transcriptional LysR family regulator
MATLQKYSSRCSGVNSPYSLTASPRVFTTVPLQTNSNANGGRANQSCLLARTLVSTNQFLKLSNYRTKATTTPSMNLRHFRTFSLAGLGLTYLPEGLVPPHINKGRLKRVLEDWCPPYPGYHLYYPSRRQPSAAFALLVEALRRRG